MIARHAPLGGLLAVILRTPIFLKGVYTMTILVKCKAKDLLVELRKVYNAYNRTNI